MPVWVGESPSRWPSADKPTVAKREPRLIHLSGLRHVPPSAGERAKPDIKSLVLLTQLGTLHRPQRLAHGKGSVLCCDRERLTCAPETFSSCDVEPDRTPDKVLTDCQALCQTPPTADHSWEDASAFTQRPRPASAPSPLSPRLTGSTQPYLEFCLFVLPDRDLKFLKDDFPTSAFCVFVSYGFSYWDKEALVKANKSLFPYDTGFPRGS